MSETAGAVRSVRANAVAIAAAQLVARALGFVTLVVLTRTLPIEDFGRYTLALAFVALLAPLADLGTDLYVTRRVSQVAGRAAELLGASLALKLVLGAGLVVLAGALAWVFRYQAPTPLLVVLAALVAVAGTTSNSWFAVLRATQRMDREAVGTVLTRVLHLGATLAAVALGAGVVWVSGAQAASALIALAAVALLARRAVPAPRFSGARSQWPELIRGGLPFALTAVVVTVYFRLDTVMLSLMSGERSTGLYGACANLLFASLLLSQSLVTAVFPVVAEAGSIAHPRARAVSQRALTLSLAASLPLGIGASAFAGPALEMLYGHHYGAGALTLALLAWTAPVLFVTNLCGHLLAATGRQRAVLVISTVNAVINVSLNLILIPRYDTAGAALATLVTELAGFAMLAATLRGELPGVVSWPAILRVLAANAAFAVLLAGLRWVAWPLPLVLTLAGLAYLAFLTMAGVLRSADLRGLLPRGAGGETP
ncbi:MAG: flippase [Candidatus Eisenbacteria bacterium]|uniref:Flippase n=1 Tax=Eiseniibacteriota bacterium TaxID=2212470 RepID=A0A849SNV2_UNCEI|nr:flippase [Candidatus Eisenbacteria bacterium]